MNNPTEIKTRIHDFLRKQFPLAQNRAAADDDRLLESGRIDSLGVLDLVHFLEEQFGISISDEELLPENFQTVARVTALVQEKVPSAERTNTSSAQGP